MIPDPRPFACRSGQTGAERRADRIGKRVVLHFPGFEPLDAQLHHARYRRAAAESAAAWGLDIELGDLCRQGSAEYFDISCQTGADYTDSRFYVFDHDTLVSARNKRPLLRRVVSGYTSACRVVLAGGLTGYFREAWRFGLFFVFPFLFVALSALVSLALATLPLLLRIDALHCLWSVPLALLFFRYGVMPVAARLHVLHLFADWDLAVAMASLDRADVDQWLVARMADVRTALRQEADEYVITSHSMGSNMAAHVIGALIEDEPDLFAGKRVTFVTLGGAILQCALLKPAARLRQRVGLIARSPATWLEVQCLTDSVHFYKSRVASLTGHADAPQPRLVFIRVKRMLTAERYRRIRRDFLRIHRQYVLGSEKQSNFDFTLMTAGPLPAATFADFSPQHLHRNDDRALPLR